MSVHYTRAESVEQALEAFEAHPEARYLAGGQSLLPALRLGLAAPGALIDLGRLHGLRGIRAEGEHTLHIGALTRHAEVADSRDVQGLIPGLAELAGQIGDRQVREMGTLGGSVAHADPAACYPAALLGLGALIQTERRVIPADSFFQGLFVTALEHGELIERVSFPVPEQSAYEKFRQPASRFALVGVFVSRGPLGVRVGVTGAAPFAFRAKALEAALQADWRPAAARALRWPADGLLSDLHGSAAYRAALIPELCARAVARASLGR